MAVVLNWLGPELAGTLSRLARLAGMLPTLNCERLTLRAWTPADVDALFDLYSRWDVVRYLGTTPTVMTDPAQAVEKIATRNAFTGPLHGVWAIVPNGEDRPVGTALLTLLPHSHTRGPSADTEVGWHLHPDVWGHGYATEAGGRLLAHAWPHGLKEVFAVTYPENAPSQAVCSRLGMAPLGMTDRYYDTSCALFRADRPA